MNCEHGVITHDDRTRRELDNKWSAALDRLSVTFTAEQGGGIPPCLESISPEERLATLRALGFRARSFFDIDTRIGLNDPPEIEKWAVLSGHVCVNLTVGFVCKEGGI